jgi:glucose/arabinose dehydrogenase
MPRGPAVIEPLEPRALLTVAGGGFTELAVATGLRQPTAVAVGPNRDPPVYLAEKSGRIRYYHDGAATAPTAVTLPVDGTGDRGLLGLAVSKYFDNDRSLYAVYVTREATPRLRVSRFYAFMDNVMLSSEKVLLDLPAYDDADGQYGAGLTAVGGGIRVGYDGTLLVAVGDAGKKENAGSLDSPFGKILRIKPDGGIPADNPFAGRDGWQRYVWAYGLHDPAAPAVHPENGIVFLNDAGEAKIQEVNRGLPGTDYGWPAGEGVGFGSAGVGATPAYQYPTSPADLTDATPAAGGRVGGGVFFSPGVLTFPLPFGGDYFFADRQAGIVQVMEFGTFRPGAVEVFATDLAVPTDLAFDVEGDLYVVAQGTGDADGQLLRYRPNGAPAVVRHPRGGTVGPGASFTLSVEAGGKEPFAYQWQRDGADIAGATDAVYVTPPLAATDDGATYRVIVSNDVGSAFSRNATVHVVAGGGVDGGGTGGGDGGTGGGGTDGGGTGGTGGGGPGPSPFPQTPATRPQGPFDLLPVVTSVVGGAVVGGSPGRASVRVYNVGRDVSPAWVSVNLYLSSDRFLDAGDAAVVKVVKAVRIKPGGSKLVKVKFAYPAGADAALAADAGFKADDAYRLLAAVVPSDTTMETDALNNTAASDGAVQLVPATVDLRAAVGPTAAAAKAGGKVVVPVTLSNAGNAPAASATVTLVVSVAPGTEFAGTAGTAAAGALATATGVATYTVRVALAPGQAKKLKVKVALPADLAAGAYTFVVSADTANVVAETDETNNAAVAAGTVTVGQ